jgi:sigma-B regulation protein RsbU (phosphoserine phosphatase)
MYTAEELERELHLKQLQINRLLNITQAINNNVSATGLYEMYRSFLSWEIGIQKMALFVRSEEESWECATSININRNILEMDVSELLPQYTKLSNLDEPGHPLLQHFDLVIPVRHKDVPISYVFIGGFSEDEDMYNKVQFITTITNVVAVAIENKRLFKRQLEQERLKQEMELAAEVQQMLIPKKLPNTREYQFDCIYKPHMSVGGDYFDFIERTDKNKIVFCIGDFTGKGLAAAMLMANFQANFHTLINREAQLEEFVHDLNRSVNMITGGDRFITFFVGEYDIPARRLKYINAGHNPPILVTRNRTTELRDGTIMLGSYEELPKLKIGIEEIEEEAIVLSYTDGLTDVRDESGTMLNEESLHRFVEDNWRLPAADFNKQLLHFIDDFRGKANLPDDFTVLTCKLYCPKC